MRRIVILGAGFGGLELSTRLSEECADDVDVVLIDKGEGFVFGFSKLDVMFGRVAADSVLHRFEDAVKPGVRFVRAEVTSIDPAAKVVTTSQGTFEAEILVVALGADLHPEATPGLLDAGHEFYTVAGAFALREVLESFDGGRVLIGVTSTPFKCPPAPSEATLLVEEFLTARGLRDRSEIGLVMPFKVPIPPSPQASAAILAAFERRGITWHPGKLVRGLAGGTATLSDGGHLPYDLFLGVPVHRAPAVVVDAGLTDDGWIPVDPLTLQTRFPQVYAIGDVTSVGTPKAGVFAEGQAAVVADGIIAGLRGGPATQYDGHGICYMEFGGHEVAKIDVTFMSGMRPEGSLEGPSAGLTADKTTFGSERIGRWFGKAWPAPLS